MSQARVEAIFIYPYRGKSAQSIKEVEAVVGHGLAGDHRRHQNRQVSLLSREAWEETMVELGARLDSQARRANLLVRESDLSTTLWKRLASGVATELRIRGETTPCAIMDRALSGLEVALRSATRGGVFGTVERGGLIRVGDAITLLEEPVTVVTGPASAHSLADS